MPPQYLLGGYKMKKILAFVLAAVMVLGMVGCGAKEEAPAAKEETKTEAPAAKEEPKKEEKVEPMTFKVSYSETEDTSWVPSPTCSSRCVPALL